MIRLERYSKIVTAAYDRFGVLKPIVFELRMPGLYKVLSAEARLASGLSLGVTARVQRGPLMIRRFLVMKPGIEFPIVRLSKHDPQQADPTALQWSFWQSTNVPTQSEQGLQVFDVSNFVGLEGFSFETE